MRSTTSARSDRASIHRLCCRPAQLHRRELSLISIVPTSAGNTIETRLRKAHLLHYFPLTITVNAFVLGAWAVSYDVQGGG